VAHGCTLQNYLSLCLAFSRPASGGVLSVLLYGVSTRVIVVCPSLPEAFIMIVQIDSHTLGAAVQTCTQSLVLLYILYSVRFFIHYRALAGIPCAHPTSRCSSLWILWQRYRGIEREIDAVVTAHRRHGAVVRLGPSEISVANLDLVTGLAQGATLEKSNWYLPFANFRYDLRRPSTLRLVNPSRRNNCMSSLDARSHTARRRRVTQPYLQHTVQKSKRITRNHGHSPL
jgi:hypothetical protein